MPLVNISILKGKSTDFIKAIADGVNSAVIETMGFPDDDRYQIITEHEPHCLEYQQRTGDRVMMYLIMRRGRSPEKAAPSRCSEPKANACSLLTTSIKARPEKLLCTTTSTGRTPTDT